MAERRAFPLRRFAAAQAQAVVASLICTGLALAQSPVTLTLSEPVQPSGRAAVIRELATPSPAAGLTAKGLESVPHCKLGFRASALPELPHAVQPPPAGHVFASAGEIETWRSRVETGPFLRDGDFRAGSPGDWDRIQKAARLMITHGEPGWVQGWPPFERATHGSRARDAAFFHLVTGEQQSLRAVRGYLLREAANPLNDLPSTLCITGADGTTPDGHLHASSWALRYLVTYDFVRAALSPEERLKIERFIQRNARFLAVHLDFGLRLIFPQRERGDYRARRLDAATTPETLRGWMRKYEPGGVCDTLSSDRPGAWPAHAYVDSAGRVGPKLSALSQWYNNRRSGLAVVVGASGILLQDDALVASAVRYFMEWVTFSVWPDGSQGEYARNGEYCIPQQGPIYSLFNLQGAALLGTALARQGDRSLLEFSTRDGLFGNASQAGDPPKSLELAIRTYVRLVNGELDWHLHEPWRERQQPRPGTRLSGNVGRYLNGPLMETYHELGLLMTARWYPDSGVQELVMRDRKRTSLPFPGAGGAAVSTGFGQWSDVFNALPAVLLLRP